MSTFELSTSFPADTVHIFLFTEVLNAIPIRERLLAGDPAYTCAFLDASMIMARLQVLAAVNRATHDSHYGLMRTKNVHSEIVYALAGTQNIGEAFKSFGLTDTSKTIVVVKVSSEDPDTVSSQVRAIIKGDEIPFDDPHLQASANLAKLSKVYKLGALGSKPPTGNKQSNPQDFEAFTKVIVGHIALRGSN